MAGLLRVALTGGIATGKSYCARKLAALGSPVIDADALAREAVAPGTPGLAAVAERFGRHILRPDGTLDRPALGRVVFGAPEARRDLEAIVHPVVYQRIREWFDELERERAAESTVAVASIPLLYETNHADDFDVVVVAACSREQQVQRLMARDGLSVTEARQRLVSQWPIEEKARLADHVISTSGTFEDTDRQVTALWDTLRQRVDA